MKYLQLLLVLCLFLSSYQITCQEVNPKDISEIGWILTFIGSDYDAVSDATTFTYEILSLDWEKGLSHWVLGIADCHEVVSFSPLQDNDRNCDPTTNVCGFKYDGGQDEDSTWEYTITLSGYVSEAEGLEYAVKGGQYYGFSTIEGPSSDCEEQAPQGTLDQQECFDYLDSLNPDSISNACEFDTVDGQIVYTFTIQYVNGFSFEDECINQTVDLEDIDIPLGGQNWEYQFSNDVITFSVPHLDIEDAGCTKYTNPEEYEWQCDISLHIWFQGYEQLQYDFTFKTTLSRVYENELTVVVEPNMVTGDCCENTLKIETTLQFCEDFSCDNYLPNNQVVERKSDIFLEHSITSSEFTYYYLIGLSLKIGAFVPNILQQDNSTPGEVRYHVQSNIAFDNMSIEAISRISETPSRRLLQQSQQEEIDEDYKVKGVNTISILESDEYQKQMGDEKEQEEEGPLSEIAIILIAGSVVALLVTGIIVKLACFSAKKPSLNGRSADYVDNNADNVSNQLSQNSESQQIDSNLVRNHDRKISIV